MFFSIICLRRSAFSEESSVNTTMRIILVAMTVVVGVPSLLVFVLPERVLDRARAQLRHPQWPRRLVTLLMTGKMPPLYSQAGITTLIQENVVAQMRSRMNETVPPLISIVALEDHLVIRYTWTVRGSEQPQRVRLETCLHCCILACMDLLVNSAQMKAVYASLLEQGFSPMVSMRKHNKQWTGRHINSPQRHPQPNDCQTHKKR